MKASIIDELYNKKKMVDKKIPIFPGHQMLNKEVLRNGVEACHTTSSTATATAGTPTKP